MEAADNTTLYIILRGVYMLTFVTAIFFHVLAKHGVIWKGVSAAWIMTILLDAGLIGLLIW